VHLIGWRESNFPLILAAHKNAIHPPANPTAILSYLPRTTPKNNNATINHRVSRARRGWPRRFDGSRGERERCTKLTQFLHLQQSARRKTHGAEATATKKDAMRPLKETSSSRQMQKSRNNEWRLHFLERELDLKGSKTVHLHDTTHCLNSGRDAQNKEERMAIKSK